MIRLLFLSSLTFRHTLPLITPSLLYPLISPSLSSNFLPHLPSYHILSYHPLSYHTLSPHPGMERLIDQFHAIVREFRLKRHDLLDYHNNKFDRDYVEFNVKVIAACSVVCGMQSTLCNLPATVNKIIIYVI